MNCPECRKEMEDGLAVLEKSLLNFLFFGFGHHVLQFKKDGKRKELLRPSDYAGCHYCEECKVSVLTNTR